MAHKPCSKNRSDRPSSSSDVSESVGTVAGRAVILKYVGKRVDGEHGAIGHECIHLSNGSRIGGIDSLLMRAGTTANPDASTSRPGELLK